MIDSQLIRRVKNAELLSSLGAGILGAGIGLLLANVLTGYGLPILFLGIASHSLGMFQKHRLERGVQIRIWWVEFLYWSCWLALAVLLIAIAIRLI